MHSKGNFINHHKLLSVYKRMNNYKDANKIWMSRDFSEHITTLRHYMFVLEKLGLIERVKAVYTYGVRNQQRKETYAWRLIQNGSH